MEQIDQQKEQKLFRDYIFFMSGQMFSILGSSVVHFSTTWYYTIQTRSASFLSLALFLALLPQLLASLIAGVIVDRSNRKLLIFISDGLQAILTLILILWFVWGIPGVWGVVIIMIFRGFCQAFHQPAVGAIVPLMVPKKFLTRMNGIQFLSSSAINVVGPALAAILLAKWNFQQILWLDIITFAIAIVPLIIAEIPSQYGQLVENSFLNGEFEIKEIHDSYEKHSFKEELRDGFNTLFSIKGMVPLFVIAMILNATLNPFFTLQTYYIIEYHNGTALNLAWIMGASQLAIFMGAFYTIIKKKWSHHADWIMGGMWLVIIGYFIIVIAPAKHFSIMIIGAFILGIGIPIMNNLYITILQMTIPSKKLGRVNSIDMVLSMAINPIMTIIAGPLAEWIGIKQLFYLMIAIAAISAALICFFTEFRTLNKNFHQESESISN